MLKICGVVMAEVVQCKQCSEGSAAKDVLLWDAEASFVLVRESVGGGTSTPEPQRRVKEPGSGDKTVQQVLRSTGTCSGRLARV